MEISPCPRFFADTGADKAGTRGDVMGRARLPTRPTLETLDLATWLTGARDRAWARHPPVS